MLGSSAKNHTENANMGIRNMLGQISEHQQELNKSKRIQKKSSKDIT